MKKLIVKSTIYLLLFTCSLFATSTLTAVSFTVSNQQVGAGSPFTAVTSYSGTGSGLYDIGQVYLAVGGTFPGAPQPHGCIFFLNVANSQVSLWDDLVQTTTSGGIGSATILQNSQCKIFLAGSTATWNGVNSLTFTGTISPVAYTGSQPIYQAVIPGPGSTAPVVDWVNKGTWTIPSGGGLPNVSLISPSSGGAGSSATFEIDATGSDQGWTSLQISPSGWSVPNSCILQYQTNGTVCLGTNAFDGSGGGYFVGCTAVGPGGSTLSNAQCSMNAANGQISVSGTTRKYIMPITFTPAYTGAKNVLGLSSTSGGAYGAPVTLGSWTVPVASTNGSLLTLESSGPTLLVPYVRFSLPDGSDPYVWDVATKGENYVMTVRDAAPNSQVWARQMFAGIGREANGDRDDIFFKPTLGPSGDNYYAFNATSDPDSVLNNIGWLVGVTDANGYFSGTFTAGPFGANGVSVYVGNSAGSPGPANADGSQSHSTFLVDSNYVGGFVFWLQHNGTPAAPNIQ